MRNHLSKKSAFSSALAVALTFAITGTATAQTAPERLLVRPHLDTQLPATFESPIVLDTGAREPVWTRAGLLADRPDELWGLASIDPEHRRPPVWDPSSETWYAWAYGALVKVLPDGSLPVILENLPGHDFDIRAELGLLVYRDADRDQIVLQRLDGTSNREVLFEGFSFFNPRLSPDGSQVVVTESRVHGGHLWQAGTTDGLRRDLGLGSQPSWSADGRSLVFLRLENDGHKFTASNLFTRDLASGSERFIARTEERIALEPRLSPDGRWVAFVDEASRELMLSRLTQEVR